MKLYIIRHGETYWNAELRFQGCSDIELNEKGLLLAEKTGMALKDTPFDICYSSPLKRARRTAALLLGERKTPIIEDARIQEISFGKMEGLTAGELPTGFAEEFFNDPLKYQAPEGGETLLEVCERTRKFYMELIGKQELADKSILISTHGCAMRALLQNIYEDASLAGFWHGKVPPNCGICAAEIQNGKAVLFLDDVVLG